MAEPMAYDERMEQSKGEQHSAPQIARAKQRPSRPLLDWVLRHQIEIALPLILPVVLLHYIYPPFRSFTSKFLFLSYPSGEGTYRRGKDDIYFVLAWVINFTALRAISIEWVLTPLATLLGISGKNKLRFAEQGWLVMYYGFFWSLGMHLWHNSPYWLNNAAIWRSWPTGDMAGTLKWYYLAQLAFWLQQILVIHIEAPRKDHYQMLTHHFITSTLITVAYVYRYVNVANVVLCLMDLVDLIFPIAKILKYLNYQTACDAAFAVFVLAWVGTRHVMYLQLCWDIYKDVPGPDTMLFGCYSGKTSQLIPDMPAQPDYFSHLFWPLMDVEGPICLNNQVKWIFLGMLLMLQTLSLIWFGMIVRVIAKILMGGNAEDTRSDDEGDEEEEEIQDVKHSTIEAPNGKRDNITDLNVCVGGSGGNSLEYDTAGSSNGFSRVSRPTSTRRRLMDAENRKELLARIGCEKPVA